MRDCEYDEEIQGQPEKTLLQKAQDRGRAALAEWDRPGLGAACRIDPGWVSASWPQGQARVRTLALPEAARLGWAEGVEELAGLGADPLLGDDDRGGWSLAGNPPLADALARGRWEVAEALERVGASPARSPGKLVWAAAFRANRAGAAEGARVARWARARGFDPWISEAAAGACAPEFLLAGAVRDESSEKLESFERALFEGYVDGPNASHALWCHVFSAVGGADKGAWLCGLYVGSSAGGGGAWGRASDLLGWALKGGCPNAARAAAAALPDDARDWAGFGGLGVEAATSDPVSLGDKEPPAHLVRAAVEALWTERGEKLASRPRDMERACFQALKTGRPALLGALLDLGPTPPEAVLERWARESRPDERSGRDARAPQRLDCLAALMAKALGAGDGGAERAAALHRLFVQGGPGARFAAWSGKGEPPELAESIARAESLLLGAQGSRAPRRAAARI